MASPAALATDAQAGCVEPVRLAVRVTEAAAAPAKHGSLPVAAEGRLAPGERRLGPLELRVDVTAAGAVATVDAVVRNASEQEVYLEGVILGFRWVRHGVGSLRFLRHGWQSWSFTGALIRMRQVSPFS